MNDFPTWTFSPDLLGASAICLVLGGLFATLLAAYTITGRVGVGRLAEKYPSAAMNIARWANKWDRLRVSLVLCVMLMQAGISVFAVLALPEATARSWVGLVALLAVLAFVATLVFHSLPRALSLSYADRISVASLPLVALLARLLFPLAWVLTWLGHSLHRAVEDGTDEEHAPSPEEEILSAVDRATTEDLEEEERHIIERVFELGDTVTREIMTPRVEMEGLEDNLTLSEAVNQVKTSSHSRFPVFHTSMDDIRGAAHVKDLLRLLSDGDAAHLVTRAMKEVPFVPESMPINDLLTLLRTEKAQLAAVVDEYGGTAGIVTMEDVMEELVGDIHDEYDEEELRIQSLSDGSVIVDARMPVDEANESFSTTIPEDDSYDSVGGYVFAELGRVPKSGEVVNGPGFQITIQTASPRKIHTVRILKAAAPPNIDS